MNNCECDKCEYCNGCGAGKRTPFHCKHPNYDYIYEYFKEHKIQKMPGFIGFGEKYSDVPVNKTTPKWCPKKMNGEK